MMNTYMVVLIIYVSICIFVYLFIDYFAVMSNNNLCTFWFSAYQFKLLFYYTLIYKLLRNIFNFIRTKKNMKSIGKNRSLHTNFREQNFFCFWFKAVYDRNSIFINFLLFTSPVFSWRYYGRCWEIDEFL